jgi:transcriptional regulator with XRE-family HTH domain
MYVGDRLSTFRKDRGWTLEETSGKLGISVPYLKALEGGRYSFSASTLCKMAAAFDRSPGAFLPQQEESDPVDESWRQVLDALTRREQRAVLELARYFVETPDAVRDLLRTFKRRLNGPGILISFEGIDGAMLHDQASRLITHLKKADLLGREAYLSTYEFDTPLWRFMIERFQQIGVGNSTRTSPAFERTLLFACERLYRQEVEIVPRLSSGALVVTSFFYLAPSVFQQAEELDDRTVVQAVEHFLLEPRMIVHLRSNPADAARKVVTTRAPQSFEMHKVFYSPYTEVGEFERSQRLYDEAIASSRTRGISVLTIEADGDPKEVSAEVIRKVLSSGLFSKDGGSEFGPSR